MSPEDIDWIARSGTRAKGKRPQYFDDPATDRLLSIVMALAGELAVTRERLDTVERLLAARGGPSRDDIESFAPDTDAAYQRGVMHREYIARVFRAVQQDLEALKADDPPVDAVVKALGAM